MRTFTGVLAAVLVAVGVGVVVPVDADAQQLARTYHFVPKQTATFEAAMKKHARDRMDHDDPWSWEVYQVVTGKGLGTFYARSGGHSWSDFDAYDEGFGAEAGLHYTADVAPTVKKVTNSVTRTDTAHARMPDNFEDITLYEVVTYHLEPGKEQQFNETIGRIHDAIVESDWPVHYTFVDPVVGTGGPQKGLVLFYENWADFEEPETPFDEMLTEAYGEEEAGRIFSRFGESIRHTESQVLRYRPDLSVQAAEEGGGDGGR